MMRSKNVILVLGMLLMIIIACSEKNNEHAWELKSISEESLADLDSINGLILQYEDLLLESQKNHSNVLEEPSKTEWAFTKPWLMEKYLPIGKNKMGYLNRHNPDVDATSDIKINSINFILAEQLFVYDIETIVKGDTVIHHTMYKNISTELLEKITPTVKQSKKFKNDWLYIVQYTIDDEW